MTSFQGEASWFCGHLGRALLQVGSVCGCNVLKPFEARLSLSLKLEGALSGHTDPDNSVRGGKGVNTNCLLCPRSREGTSHHYLWTELTLPSVWTAPPPAPRYLYGLFPWLLQGFIQMSPSQWGLDHFIKNRSLESEVTPQGHTVQGWVCLAPCTSYSTLTSSAGIFLHDPGCEGPCPSSSRQEKQVSERWNDLLNVTQAITW